MSSVEFLHVLMGTQSNPVLLHIYVETLSPVTPYRPFSRAASLSSLSIKVSYILDKASTCLPSLPAFSRNVCHWPATRIDFLPGNWPWLGSSLLLPHPFPTLFLPTCFRSLELYLDPLHRQWSWMLCNRCFVYLFYFCFTLSWVNIRSLWVSEIWSIGRDRPLSLKEERGVSVFMGCKFHNHMTYPIH